MAGMLSRKISWARQRLTSLTPLALAGLALIIARRRLSPVAATAVPVVSTSSLSATKGPSPAADTIASNPQSPSARAAAPFLQDTPTATPPKRGRAVIPEGEFPLVDISLHSVSLSHMV